MNKIFFLPDKSSDVLCRKEFIYRRINHLPEKEKRKKKQLKITKSHFSYQYYKYRINNAQRILREKQNKKWFVFQRITHIHL